MNNAEYTFPFHSGVRALVERWGGWSTERLSAAPRLLRCRSRLPSPPTAGRTAVAPRRARVADARAARARAVLESGGAAQ